VDLQMPQLHGTEVVREVRARGLNLPVLVLTGDEHPGTEVELLEAGATDFLRKPVSPPVLAARVQALLRR
jgi:DNA-binding response OmpR family regulator